MTSTRERIVGSGVDPAGPAGTSARTRISHAPKPAPAPVAPLGSRRRGTRAVDATFAEECPAEKGSPGVVRAVVTLRRRREVGTGAGLDDLAIAVGFGSLHEVRPNRLRAVPTHQPDLAAPSSIEPVIALHGPGLRGVGVEGPGLHGFGVPGFPVDVPVPGSPIHGFGVQGPVRHGLVQPALLAGPGVRERQRGEQRSLVPSAAVRSLASVPVRSPARVLDSAPLRLTARGRAVLLIIAAAIGVAVVVSAWFGAATSPAPTLAAPPSQVVVHSGDTLWTIAGRIAPNRDPRAVVDRLLRINHLDSPGLVPGQILRTH